MEPVDLRPCDDGCLAYGLAADGTLAHVAEVPRGLACGCRCPSCGGALVARRGEIRAAHFAHHAVGQCAGAWETTLHLLAKDVLSEARSVTLPEAFAEFEGMREPVPGATVFRYSSVREEVDLGSVRPDVIVNGGGRELLVEIAVTHFCDPAKIAKLRERDLPAIEIDLSAVPKLASRREHARFILTAAPRIWLHNAKILAAEDRLREEAARREAERMERRRAAWSADADHLAEAAAAPVERGNGPWTSEVRDAGLGDLLDRETEGDFCFAVTRENWQARLISYALKEGRAESFDLGEVFDRMLSHEFLRPGFNRSAWSPEETEVIRGRLPGFRPPWTVLAAYAAALVEVGFLGRAKDGGLIVTAAAAAAAKETTERKRQARFRRAELTRLVGALKEPLGQNADEIVERWKETALPGNAATPEQLAETGGEVWDDLVRALRDLDGMARPGGRPIPRERLLALPLEEVRKKRMAEAEQRDADRAARRRQTAVAFLVRVRGEAETELGVEAGCAWLKERLGGADHDPGSDDRFEPSSAFRRDLEAELRLKVDRARAARDAETDRLLARGQEEARREKLRQTLRKTAVAALKDTGRADLWMRAKHPALGGSPLEVCVKEGGLARCSRLLDAARRR